MTDLALDNYRGLRRTQAAWGHDTDDAPEHHEWLRDLLPAYFTGPFAPHHLDLLTWVFQLEPGRRPRPYVAVWPRGGAKSTIAEAAVVTVGARYTRRYALYVSETQDLADRHVATIGAMLTSRQVAAQHPSLARRSLTVHGHSRGWRRNRLSTAAGLTVDALGLDTAARGLKVEDRRPDLIVLDDIDGKHDTPRVVAKKIETLTMTILPAGSDDAAVLAVQNLVHPDSTFAMLADGRADFLADRTVSGPIPAIHGLAYERSPDDVYEETGRRYLITAGTPTWAGYPIARCEENLNEWGPTAFLEEAQHEVEPAPGGMYDDIAFEHVAPDDVPPLDRVVVWVDPAVTDTDQSDAQGVQADGITGDGTIYRLRSFEGRTSPQKAMVLALRWGYELGAVHVGVETDQGGDTWRSVYREAVQTLAGEGYDPDEAPAFRSAKAGAGHGGKAERSARMLADYERGRLRHVIGTHPILERALRRFPKTKPLDLADCCLVGETLVATAQGERPICDLVAGDLVWTRAGLRPVERAGLTRRRAEVIGLRTEDGQEIVGTGEHPVWVVGQGWTPLASVRRDMLVMVWQGSRTSSTGDRRGGDTRTHDNEHTGFTTATPARSKRSTAASTRTRMGLSPRPPMSITLTATRSTTRPRTLWRSPAPSIGRRKEALGPTAMLWSRIWLRSGLSRPRGIAPMRAGLGIATTAERSGRDASSARSSVVCAERRSRPDTLARSRFAPVAAAMPTTARTPTTSRRRSARSAGSRSLTPATGESVATAVRRVATVESRGTADVYNLSVAGEPEYFAGGILVHNCYWSWQDLRGTKPRRQPRVIAVTRRR